MSGMLGVGGGFMKVPAMTEGMGVPIKVAAATSNFMIGVTAVASLFVYFARGYMEPYAAVPVALGVVAGAIAGAVTSSRVSPVVLRRLLVVLLLFVSVQMALKAFGVDVGR
ncbi:MAG: sulfite exporter TauE/SafE family protein [Microthrixaceae bacterium]|nr:sulfite exporter TauE/SafE family protein [Microthrixaceae bacterium]